MLVICDQCFDIRDARLNSYCPGCLATSHLFTLRDEAGLRRGIEIYEQATIPRAAADNAIARRLEAIQRLKAAEAEGGEV